MASVDPAQASNADTAASKAFSLLTANSGADCTRAAAARRAIPLAEAGSIDSLGASAIETHSCTFHDVRGHRNPITQTEFHSLLCVLDGQDGYPRPERLGGSNHLIPNLSASRLNPRPHRIRW